MDSPNVFQRLKELKEYVTPILERNGQIFDSYGPNDEYQVGARHKLWLKFENEITLFLTIDAFMELILTGEQETASQENLRKLSIDL